MITQNAFSYKDLQYILHDPRFANDDVLNVFVMLKCDCLAFWVILLMSLFWGNIVVFLCFLFPVCTCFFFTFSIAIVLESLLLLYHPKSIQQGMDLVSFCCSLWGCHFWWFFDVFLRPKWRPNIGPDDTFPTHGTPRCPNDGQVVPKGSKMMPKGSPGCPKWFPNGPKWCPKGAQGTQNDAHGAQWLPRVPEIHQNDAQMVPRERKMMLMVPKGDPSWRERNRHEQLDPNPARTTANPTPASELLRGSRRPSSVNFHVHVGHRFKFFLFLVTFWAWSCCWTLIHWSYR